MDIPFMLLQGYRLAREDHPERFVRAAEIVEMHLESGQVVIRMRDTTDILTNITADLLAEDSVKVGDMLLVDINNNRSCFPRAKFLEFFQPMNDVAFAAAIEQAQAAAAKRLADNPPPEADYAPPQDTDESNATPVLEPTITTAEEQPAETAETVEDASNVADPAT